MHLPVLYVSCALHAGLVTTMQDVDHHQFKSLMVKIWQRAQHEAQKAAQAEATLREQEAVSALANAICCAPSCAYLSHSDFLQICWYMQVFYAAM